MNDSKDKDGKGSSAQEEEEKKTGENDVSLDDDITLSEEEDATGDGWKTIKKLKERLHACEKERQEYLLGWQRAKADFINARREEKEARKKYITYAKENILFEIVPVIDNFEHAFANKESWEAVPEGWRKGIEYIYSQFLKVIENNGLMQTNPLGDVFDPLMHESVESVVTEKGEEQGKIVAVLAKGYTLNGKVVRPAKVKVAAFRNSV